MSDIFISYRRQDASGSAGRLADHLEKFFTEKAIFRDVSAIEDGQDFGEAIGKQLKSCSVFLAVIGPRWLDAVDANGQRRLNDPEDWPRKEIRVALQRNDIRVIPVLVDNARLPGEQELPDDLKPLLKRNARLITDAGWDDEIKRLARSISKVMSWHRRLRLEWFLNPYGVMLFSLLPLMLLAGSIIYIRKDIIWADTAKQSNLEFPDIQKSIDGQTLFVSPYELFPSTSKNHEKQLNGIFDIVLGHNVQIFLSKLTDHAPNIGIRTLPIAIHSSDSEKAIKAGLELNALGIVTGEGEIENKSGETIVNLRSTFYVIPRNEHFSSNRTEIQDVVPISKLSPLEMDKRLGKSWGQNAVIAYIVKVLDGTKTALEKDPEKLEDLRRMLLAMRSQMGSNDPLLKDVQSLFSYIDNILPTAKPAGVKQ